jgi:hypothetical protein
VSSSRDARIEQEIVIQADDQVGLLAQITTLLGDMGISIFGIAVRTEEAEANLHLLTSAQTHARDALRSAGFLVKDRDVITLELPNHPGFLCRVAAALARKELALTSLYATTLEESGKTLVVFTTSQNDKAVQVLRGH